MKVQTIIHKRFTPKTIFLIDSIGALFSFLFLNQILPSFNNELGIEKNNLILLSIPIPLYFIYSGICFFKANEKSALFLKVISIANLVYSIFTLSLVFLFLKGVKFFGFFYFISESIIILVLAYIEWKISYTKIKHQ